MCSCAANVVSVVVMNTRPLTRTDVIVIGGGPVGIALAIDLRQRGISCQVIERHSTLQNIPKGQNLTQRTMEYLARLGAEGNIREGRTITAPGVGGMTVYGSLTSGIEYDWLVRSKLAAFYHRSSERIPQPVTEQGLRERAAELEIPIAYGWTAELVSSAVDEVVIRSEDRAGEIVESIAGYIVACDGAGSSTRDAARITQTRVEHDKRMALTVFRSPELDEVVSAHPDRQFFTVINPKYDGYWQFAGRVDSDSRWFFHAPVADDETRESLDVDVLIAEAVGHPVTLETEYVGFWDLRFAIADDYRSGRVFVAGDAAHSHPPYGGYGINSGLEDVANLAWKLEIALASGDDAILDTYDEERRPIFESTAADFIDRSIREDRAFLRDFSPDDREAFNAEWQRRADFAAAEVGRYEPHYGVSSLVTGGIGETSAVGDHVVSARPGHRLAPWRAGDTTLLDALGRGFTLLTTEPAAPAASAAASTIGVDLEIVQIGAEAAEVYGASRVLVRPDIYIAATAETDADIATALTTATARAAVAA